MSRLPTVTSDIPRDLRQFLDRVRETLGARGEDRLVTAREVSALALSDPAGSGTSPGGSRQTYVTPPAPTGLVAEGALANIILTWDAPVYAGHAHTEVWAAEAPSGGGDPALGDAVLIGQSPGSIYAHNLGGNATRWYWVRHVNIGGEAGPYNAVDGTKGQTGLDPSYLVSLLQGQVSESELATSLGQRIDLIDAPESVAGSVNSRIAVVQGQVNDLLNIPAWDSTTTYGTGDQVTYDGKLYNALQPSTNVVPTDTAYWQLVGNYTTLGDAVAANTLSISNLETEVGTVATETDALATQLRGGYTGTDLSQVTTGLLYEEREARSEADSSLATDLSSLSATVESNRSTLLASIQDESTARADADSALANDISTVTAFANTRARVFYQSTPPTGTAGSPLVEGDLWVDSNRTYADDYVAGDYVIRSNRLHRWSGAQWVEAMDYGFADTFSAINTERTARADADNALAQDITTLQSTVDGNTAAIQSEATTRADADNALAQDITTLQSTVDGNTAAIQSEATTRATQTGDLFAQYTVKVDLNGYVSGYGLASTNSDGTPTSEFVVRADSFSIGSPSGTSPAPAFPFIVRTTSTTIGGESVPAGAYIADAFIQNGSIGTAKIGDAAIDTAKIANAAIVEAKIGDAEIGSTKIRDAAITNTKIENGAITNAKIGDAEITRAKIGDGEITRAKIASAAIGLAEIDTASITDLSAISADVGSITAGRMQSADGKFLIDLNQKTIRITV